MMALISIHSLSKMRIAASDGELGKVEQLFFDDESWTIRYLVVQTGSWLLGKKVLISPIAVSRLNWEEFTIEVNLTREQVEQSPDMDSDQPVSRQMESQYHDYYRWPYYWNGAAAWGMAAYPGMLVGAYPRSALANESAAWKRQKEEGDTHLRSSKETIGYSVEALDASFGQVEDFLMDDQSWKIRYLIVDTRKFWPSKSVLLPPEWVESVSWSGQKFRIAVSERVVKEAPPYDPKLGVDRDYEQRLHGYYGRSGYWDMESDLDKDQRAV
jgi:sporulation protein YlmC with PRC-barrel domain